LSIHEKYCTIEYLGISSRARQLVITVKNSNCPARPLAELTQQNRLFVSLRHKLTFFVLLLSVSPFEGSITAVNKHLNLTIVLGAFAKLRKATISFVCPSVCMEQLGSHWTDFHNI